MVDILYAEDEPSVRANYQEIFEEDGYSVVSFSTADEVRSALEEGSVKLYILDIALGSERRAGYSLCSEILLMNPNAKVMFLTTNTDESDRKMGIKCGAKAHLGKDEPLKHIRASIAKLLH